MTSPTIQQKWTPGPWHRLYSEDHQQPAIVTWDERMGHPKGIVAFINRSQYNPDDKWLSDTDAANARLIAAAPEMYDQIDELLSGWMCDEKPLVYAPRNQCDCWKCVTAKRVYALMKRIKGED